MKPAASSLFKRLPFFVFIGVVIVFAIILLMAFTYLFLWGLFIGMILWVIASIKLYFFPPQKLPKKTEQGRIIDQRRED